MKVVKVRDASANDLAQFATVNLGIPGVYPQIGKERIIAIIRDAGFDKESIEIEVESMKKARELRTSSSKLPTDAQDSGDEAANRLVKIQIPLEEKPGGTEPVPVGVNGALMLIPRGEIVAIPYKYLEALQHAVAKHPVTDENGAVIGWREAMAYPVSVFEAA